MAALPVTRLRALPGALLLGAALAVAGPALVSTADTSSPVAVPSAVSTASGASVTIPLRGSSPTGAALQYRLSLFASYGQVTISGSTATYTPQAGFAGSDHFAFLVSDGTSASDPVDVTIAVAAPVVVAPPAPPVVVAPVAPVAPAAPTARSTAAAPAAASSAESSATPAADSAAADADGASTPNSEARDAYSIAAALDALRTGLAAAAESLS